MDQYDTEMKSDNSRSDNEKVECEHCNEIMGSDQYCKHVRRYCINT